MQPAEAAFFRPNCRISTPKPTPMSKPNLQKRAAEMAIRAAELLMKDLDLDIQRHETLIKEWNAWVDAGEVEDDRPDIEPDENPPTPNRQLFYALQVAAAAARDHKPGRPRKPRKEPPRTPPQREKRK